MALIVETGAGLADANSYAGVATANAYFDARDVVAWADASTREKERALIRATDYIDASFIFRSVRATDTQALECPRFGFDEIPAPLVKATMEMALIMLTEDPFAPVKERDVVETTKKLEGVGETTVKYDTDRKVVDSYPMIARILKAIASPRASGGGTIRLTR